MSATAGGSHLMKDCVGWTCKVKKSFDALQSDVGGGANAAAAPYISAVVGEEGIIEKVDTGTETAYVALRSRQDCPRVWVLFSCLEIGTLPLKESVGWTCKVKELFSALRYDIPGVQYISAAVGETGVIEKVDIGTGTAYVALRSRQYCPRIWALYHYLEVGKPSGSWTVNFGVPEIISRGISVPPTSLGENDLRRHLYPLLCGFHDHAIGLMNIRQANLVANDAAIRQTVDAFIQSVRDASKDLLKVLVKPSFTFREVMDACVRTQGEKDGRAGIYLRVYSGFQPTSEYAGHKPYAYVGQSNHIGRRTREHRLARDNPKNDMYNKVHYQVARRANKQVDVYLLSVHDVNEGGSEDEGKVRRDLMEQVWFLLLGTYSKSLKNWTLRLNDESKAAPSVAVDIDKHSDFHVYSKIADLAFTSSGYGKDCLRSSSANFGTQDGLNFSSALTATARSYSGSEKLLLVRLERKDRYIFHRSSRTMTDRRSAGFQILPLIAAADKEVYWTVPGSKAEDPNSEERDQRPLPGDEVFVTFEVMKESIHAAPFFRLPDAGIFSNWEDVNKIGVKIFWNSKKYDKMFWRYIQGSDTQSYVDKAMPGSRDKFATGSTLYMHLMNAQYPDKQKFVKLPNFSRQITLKVDGFNQKIHTIESSNALKDLHAVMTGAGPGARRMREAGLENVDGDWQSRDVDWVDNSPIWARAKMDGASDAEIKTWKKYTKTVPFCDRCYLINVGHGVNESVCEQTVDLPNRCTNCAVAGLPCSWTNLLKLGGPNFYIKLTPTGRRRKVGGPFYDEIHKLLYAQPYNEDAQRRRELPESAQFQKLIMKANQESEETEETE